jgi:Tfp pilus assembly protein PilF
MLVDTLWLQAPVLAARSSFSLSTVPAAARRLRSPLRRLGAIAGVVAAAVLAGCASTAPALPPEALFDDGLFAAPAQRPDPAAVFALDAPMRQYLAGPIATRARQVGAQRALFDALYAGGRELRVDFDASATRTAAETFDARTGNCLSLVVMTTAFAKALGMTVSFQSPIVEEIWSRRGGLTIRNGHVNVTLGPRRIDFPHRVPGAYLSVGMASSDLTIDFLPPEQLRGLRMRSVSEATLLSMYMNNRAVEALTAGRLDDAYWWAREGIRQDPGFTGSLNTLGVIFLRRGAPMQAERALRQALALESRNTLVLGNLAQALDRRGRPEEAAEVRRRLAALEPQAAYAFFDRGLSAAQAGDWALARRMFASEVALPNYDPEVSLWLGVAEYRLGHLDAARERLEQALKDGSTPDERARYAAKLEWLRGVH